MMVQLDWPQLTLITRSHRDVPPAGQKGRVTGIKSKAVDGPIKMAIRVAVSNSKAIVNLLLFVSTAPSPKQKVRVKRKRGSVNRK